MPTVLAPDGTSLAFEAREVAQPRAALLILPGWSDHAGRYGPTADTLAAASIATYTLDLRGHGRSGGRRGRPERDATRQQGESSDHDDPPSLPARVDSRAA